MIYLIIYSLVCIAIVAIHEVGKRQTPEHFLVADRKVGGLFGAFAVAASWIWAPALFVSTQVGYQWGYSGLFWFTLPNMLALMLFAPVANRIRHVLPTGFSYIGFIRNKGGYFRELQLFIQLLVQVLCCAIQLTAGAELITLISGTSYTAIICVMVAAPLCYCLIAGLVSSVLIDCIKYFVIIGSIGLIYLNLPLSHNIPALIHCKFNPFDQTMLLQFGLASCLTLIFGIFSNHQQWQRAFAADYSQVRKIFSSAGFLHGIVTFSLGTLGVLIYQSGYVTHHLQTVGAEYIAQNMVPFFLATFIVMVLSGLCATIGSAMCAFGSLYATEIATKQDPVIASRQAIVVLSILAALVAIFRVPLITLWMFCGFIRLGTATPTIGSIFSKKLSGKVGTVAIITSIVVSTPLFIYGSIQDNSIWRTIGMILCLLISTSICLLQIFSATKDKSPIIQDNNLAEFFASSPLPGSNLQVERVKGKLRKVDT